MKNYILFLFLAFVTFAEAQVTVAFKDFKLNNNPYSISNPINLGTDGSVNVKFTALLSKSSTYVVGNCTLFVRTYNGYGQHTDLITPMNLYLPDSGTSFASAIDVNINATDLTYEQGNYLSVELVDQDTGAVWYSPKPTLIKTPSYTLNPTSINIPCGSTAPITLTCNSNTNVGSFVYKWNVGTGWSKDGNPVSGIITTSTNTITLTPTNPNFLPSPISLEILWNTNYSYGITCVVKREIFDNSNTLQISGNSTTVCTFPSTVSYNVNSGIGDTVSWTSSDTTVGEVQTVTGSSTSVVIKRQGEFILTAVVSNECGQTKTLTKKIWSGTPLVYMPNVACGNPYSSVCFNSNYNVPTGQYSNIVVDALGFESTANLDTDFEWEKVDGSFTFASYGNGYYSNVSNNGTKVTGRMAIMYITSGYNYLQVRARAKNSCGWGPWKSILFQSGGSKMAVPKIYQVSPNPASDFINIGLVEENVSISKVGNARAYAELFSTSGNKIKTIDLNNNNEARLSISGLAQGIYMLKIHSGSIIEEHQVIVK